MTTPRSTRLFAVAATLAALTVTPLVAFADADYIAPGASWTYANYDLLTTT